MFLRTVALYAFAGACVSAVLSGCSTTGGSLQVAPVVPGKIREASSLVRHGGIPASLIIGEYSFLTGFPPAESREIFSLSGGEWKTRAGCQFGGDGVAAGSRDDPNPLFGIDREDGVIYECSLVNGNPIRTLDIRPGKPYQVTADNVNDVAALTRTPEGNPRIALFPFGYGNPIVISKGLANPSYAVFDDARDLFVADRDANKVVEYAPASDQVISTITDGIDQPVALYFAGDGTLWVSNAGAAKAGADNVTGYRNGRFFQVLFFVNSEPGALMAHGDHLYVALSDRNGPGYIFDYNLTNPAASADITAGIDHPSAVVYCAPNVCVLNSRTVTVYSSDKLVQTIDFGRHTTPHSLAAEL